MYTEKNSPTEVEILEVDFYLRQVVDLNSCALTSHCTLMKCFPTLEQINGLY